MLISAALIGSGVGLSLGAAYLAGGMAGHASDHAHSQRIAVAAAEGYDHQASAVRVGGLSEAMLRLATSPLRSQTAIEAPKARSASDLECLTQAVYYEARGENPTGQFAVAQVVMNRVKHPAFPKTVCAVVFQGAGRRHGCQFSFACDGSMRAGRETSAWTRARRVASRALAGQAIAQVGRATHFHTTGVSPAWGPQMSRVAQVGMHVFYRLSPRKAGQLATAPVVLTAGPEADTDLKLEPAMIEAPTIAAPPATTDGAPKGEASQAVAAPAAEKPAEAAGLTAAQPAA